MKCRRLIRCSMLAVLAIACTPISSFGLIITPDYNDFEGEQLKVLKEAVKEWTDLLPCSDQINIPIEFVCDNNLAGLGLAEVQGYPRQRWPLLEPC